MDPQVEIAIISTVGGVAIAYITYVLARRKKASAPKDRMETIFDGYEKLITQQQAEIERKGSVITSLENVVQRLEDELAKTRTLLNEAREDLSNTREQNEELKTQLLDMRKQYSDSGTV